jgi:hypothetical protein
LHDGGNEHAGSEITKAVSWVSRTPVRKRTMAFESGVASLGQFVEQRREYLGTGLFSTEINR